MPVNFLDELTKNKIIAQSSASNPVSPLGTQPQPTPHPGGVPYDTEGNPIAAWWERMNAPLDLTGMAQRLEDPVGKTGFEQLAGSAAALIPRGFSGLHNSITQPVKDFFTKEGAPETEQKEDAWLKDFQTKVLASGFGGGGGVRPGATTELANLGKLSPNPAAPQHAGVVGPDLSGFNSILEQMKPTAPDEAALKASRRMSIFDALGAGAGDIANSDRAVTAFASLAKSVSAGAREGRLKAEEAKTKYTADVQKWQQLKANGALEEAQLMAQTINANADNDYNNILAAWKNDITNKSYKEPKILNSNANGLTLQVVNPDGETVIQQISPAMYGANSRGGAGSSPRNKLTKYEEASQVQGPANIIGAVVKSFFEEFGDVGLTAAFTPEQMDLFNERAMEYANQASGASADQGMREQNLRNARARVLYEEMLKNKKVAEQIHEMVMGQR